ncbi:MAG: flagellar hook-basal body complex protein [Lachnospiraceae bacterium]|nr:flagellar hook-basal body complex protein [Lachnospiraceae bacterium]
MMRSLFSGISGLKVHQTRMDVIGNNISNVNTSGFRAGTAHFTDVFYQTTKSASGPNAATGAAGTNAMQIGLGANVAAISVDLSGTGATQRTDRGMDMMINGDAFFIVRSNGSTYFTKAGYMDIDADGTLYCATNGATVLGWSVDENGEIRKDTVAPLTLMGGEFAYSAPTATSRTSLKGNIDSMDPLVAYSEDGVGNYPISVSFYDNVGNLFSAKFTIAKASEDTDSTFTIRLADVQGPDGKSILRRETLDENGNPTYEPTEQYLNFNGEELSYDVDADGNIIFDDAQWPTLTFNGSTGHFTSVSSDDGETLNLTLNPSEENNAFPLGGVSIDFSNLTKYASDGNTSVQPDYRNGNEAGSLQGYSIQTDGKIYGVYSNGDKRLMGQIAVATFPNPSGLEAVGNSLYAATLNSGEFDGIGIDITEIGSFSVGALEMSDVDLATEFTSMIVTQRGFQANSRVITTTDTMLEELVNLKR